MSLYYHCVWSAQSRYEDSNYYNLGDFELADGGEIKDTSIEGILEQAAHLRFEFEWGEAGKEQGTISFSPIRTVCNEQEFDVSLLGTTKAQVAWDLKKKQEALLKLEREQQEEKARQQRIEQQELATLARLQEKYRRDLK